MFSIRKSSTELNDASEPRWHFPSALSPEAHAKWGLYTIIEYMGLHEILPPGAGQNRAKLQKDIEEYPTAYAIPPAPMNHVKYLMAGPAEMPFRNWYTANTNHFHLTDSVS